MIACIFGGLFLFYILAKTNYYEIILPHKTC